MKHSFHLSILLSACALGLMDQPTPGQTCNDPIPLIGDTIRIGPNVSAAHDKYSTSIGVSGDYAIGGAIEEGPGTQQRGFAIIHYRHQGGLDQWGEVKRLTSPDSFADQVFVTRNSIQHISVNTAILTLSQRFTSTKEPRK